MTLMLDTVDPAIVGMAADRLALAGDLMQRQFDEGRSPMLAAIVARHGQVVFTKTLGDHRPGGPPLALDSVFPLASNGKPMTAATLLALVERGMVGLTEPAVDYLPELAAGDNGEVLVHHLLTHTSGWDQDDIRASMDAMVAAGDRSQIPPNRDLLSHLFLTSGWAVPRRRAAGEAMGYTNFNYSLISEIVRRVTGGTLDAAMSDLLFDPTGMTRSAVIVPDSLLPHVVERPPGIPHAPGHADTVLAHFDPLWLSCDDGMCGVHASPLDNLRFLEMVRNGGVAGDTRVLSPAAIQVMTTNQIPGVAADLGFIKLREASWAYAFNVATADPLAHYRGGTPSRGTLRHGGSGGVTSWVDPKLGITGVYFEILTEEDEFGGPVSWAIDRFEDVVTSAVLD